MKREQHQKFWNAVFTTLRVMYTLPMLIIYVFLVPIINYIGYVWIDDFEEFKVKDIPHGLSGFVTLVGYAVLTLGFSPGAHAQVPPNPFLFDFFQIMTFVGLGLGVAWGIKHHGLLDEGEEW